MSKFPLLNVKEKQLFESVAFWWVALMIIGNFKLVGGNQVLKTLWVSLLCRLVQYWRLTVKLKICHISTKSEWSIYTSTLESTIQLEKMTVTSVLLTITHRRAKKARFFSRSNSFWTLFFLCYHQIFIGFNFDLSRRILLFFLFRIIHSKPL